MHWNDHMQRMIRALCCVLLIWTSPAFAIDPITPTLTGPDDVVNRRTQLINLSWGTSCWTPCLPVTLPTVTTGISNPFPSYNVARVDQYVASMSNGQSNTSNLYNANSPNNGRVVILNPGHQGTCDWTAFSAGYRVQPMMQALLAAGYSVFAMNMPGCGSTVAHMALFSSYSSLAMQYFFEPAIQAMNYWDANTSFSRYDATGLSGGGFTTGVLPALDARVKISIHVGDGVPGQIMSGVNCPYYCGEGCTVVNCTEGNWEPFYTIAGFLDLYIMAGYGPNRRNFQILNYYDSSNSGNTQWINGGDAAFYDVDFVTFFRNYVNAAKLLEPNVMPSNFDGMIDYIANQHQFSTHTQQIILSIFGSVGAGTAGGGRRLLHMW